MLRSLRTAKHIRILLAVLVTALFVPFRQAEANWYYDVWMYCKYPCGPVGCDCWDA